jgi:hypothetical protein
MLRCHDHGDAVVWRVGDGVGQGVGSAHTARIVGAGRAVIGCARGSGRVGATELG